MNEPLDMSTDAAWEEWGCRDPYYGVITQPQFRRGAMTEDARKEFFASSESHAQYTFSTIRRYVNPSFAPKRILDFGCGVGRLLVAYAKMAQEVVGLDVSPSMLEEARRNCDEHKLLNVRLLLSDDHLSAVNETFDFIHSFIVFQHIPVIRGRTILSNLLQRLAPGGAAALHLTYSKSHYAATYGVAPSESLLSRPAPPLVSKDADPEMQMNPYNLNEVFFAIQRFGVTQIHNEFSDHGGELGTFLFFRAPLEATARPAAASGSL